MGTLESDCHRENTRKHRLTPAERRGTLANIGGNSSPLFAISNGPLSPIELLNENRNALCAPKFRARMPMLVANQGTSEGRTQTQ